MMMQNRNLIIGLAACFFLVGVGCFDDANQAQSQDPTSQPSRQAEEPETQSERINQLIVQASNAFSSGDYGQAFEKSGEVCKLKPDNLSYLMFRGRICFAAGKMEECISAYDTAIGLQPSIEPQLWQRGLALYYAKRFSDGVKQFETHQKINSQDVENAVWHLLCAAQVSDVDQARKKLIPITGDTRVPMSQIYELFAGRMTPGQVLAAAQKTTRVVKPGSEQQRLQLYYAHLYIGLFHEMLKDPAAAKASLKKAVEINPLDKTNFMGQVARVHLMLRESAVPGK